MVQAEQAINSRADRLRTEAPAEDELKVRGDSTFDFDWFTDEDLRNLFAPLIASEE